MKNYEIDQIKTLEFKEAIRTKVAMYAGSADNNGAFQVFKEILGNSIDEFMNHYGEKIEVVYYEDGSISVQDYGRGIPFSVDEKDDTFKNVFISSHTSGKFDHKAYKNSVGLHGIGLKLAALSSLSFMTVSYREKNLVKMSLEKGEITSYSIEENTTNIKHGTYIKYQLDPTVFHVEELNNDSEPVIKFCRLCSFLNAGLEIKVDDRKENKKHIFKSKGVIDLLNEDHPQQLIAPILGSAKDAEDEVEICYTWVNNSTEKFYLFVNGMQITDGGQPIVGFRTGLTRTVNHLTKNKFKGENIRRGIVYIINIKCLNPSFSDQRKSQINNSNLRSLTDKAISDSLRTFLEHTPLKFDAMVNLFAKTEKAEQAAERARNAVLTSTKEIERISSKKVFSSNKLKDAEVLGLNSTLMLVEGDSASGTLTATRDPKNYGILMLRGKVISTMTNSIDKVLENEEVQLLIAALGLSPKSYKQKNLRYGKVAITVDADADGANINNLIISLFYVLFPDFIKEGRLYKIHSPLYRVKSKSFTDYYYSEQEFVNRKRNGETDRFKGLGSLEVEDGHAIFFNEKTRRMEQLTWDDRAEYTINSLLGEDTEPRKKFVFENINFNEYGDIS